MVNNAQSNITGLSLSLMGFALYSIHDVIVKLLGVYYTPFQILFFSVLFSFPLVLLFMLRNPKVGSLWPHNPTQMAIRVLAASISGFCAFYAFSVLPLAQTYALLFLTPIFITVFSIPFLIPMKLVIFSKGKILFMFKISELFILVYTAINLIFLEL